MITKRTFSLLLCASLPIAGTMAAIPFLNTKPASAVSGQYKGIKLPYPAGQSRTIERGGSAHGSGRHAVDFKMSYEDVLAIKGGKVAVATKDQYGGKYLLIDHNDGYCSMYLHLDSFKVSPGQQIQQGQSIAKSGNTGNSSGPHLHLAVFQKRPNQGCNASPSQEIAMIFDEKPSGELVGGDKIVSQNGTSSNNSDTFKQPISSSIKVTQQSVNLRVCGSNLPGRRVYVQMWRDAAYGYPAKDWNTSKVATSNCTDFPDLEGAGDSFSGVTYYTVASLTPTPAGEAAKKRTSCWGTTGGKFLCDAGRR